LITRLPDYPITRFRNHRVCMYRFATRRKRLI